MNRNHSFTTRFYGKVDSLAVKILREGESYRQKKARQKAEVERRHQAYFDGIWRGFR